ncbi:hypothetical protein NDS46_31270 (plasmid) [Paenibacillus thiaminolyticus]|uniref:hypothetical protein n=1 Tax=Paenibacillus thiaminolyticus TaxID=49283 RepID=UPI00232E2AF3|nr:hypothetical protein [Paenibacillus thiaminolyticus]WCF11439.1 hypothetical protein NDS46_31270 [Paenibacillus thiaminolyticus]
MLIKVKSKESLKTLYEVLCDRNFDVIDPLSEKEIQLRVKEENQAEFETLIASYIAYIFFYNVAKEKIKSLSINEEVKNRLLDDAIDYFKGTMYWRGLTLVLVSDYLTKSNSLHVYSFMLFNMKGFKAEVEEYIEALLHAVDEVGNEGL